MTKAMLDHLGLVHMFRVPQQRDDKTGPLAEPDHARIYDPVIGRFLSPDSVLQFPGNIQSYDRYQYVLNNPVSFTDPSGHFIPLIVGMVMVAQKVYWVVSVRRSTFYRY